MVSALLSAQFLDFNPSSVTTGVANHASRRKRDLSRTEAAAAKTDYGVCL